MADDAQERQSKAMKNQEAAEAAQKRLRELKSRQESLDKDRAEIEAARRKAQSDLEDVNERIASVQELKADAREMEMLEAQIKGVEAERQQLAEEMRKLLASGWLAPASAKLSAVLARVAAKNDAAQEKQREVRAARDRVDLLQKQLNGGTCPTCHQELPPPATATEREFTVAKAKLQRLTDEAGDGPDLPRERQIRALMDTDTIRAYQDKQAQFDKILAAQYDRKRRLSTIKDRLKDNDAAKIRQLGSEQERLEQIIADYSDRLRQFDGVQAKIDGEQRRNANALRKLSGAQPTLAAEAYFFDYVQELTDRTIGRYRERTRAEVEQTATDMFMKLIRDSEGYDGIQIGSDYRVDLVGKRGPSMKTSEGGRQLIALSLIGALKQAAVRGGPVVLDSPLARLDLKHRENVLLRWVPELGTQAILLVQSGELTEQQAHEIMGSRVGQAYRILRPNNDPEEAIIERTQ
jgi:DNA sulfur modification protein DndD